METVAVDWSYAISTLVIRFVGIFVVLGFLQIVMQITGRIFTRLDAKDRETAHQKGAQATDAMTDEQAAAVAVALYLHGRSR